MREGPAPPEEWAFLWFAYMLVFAALMVAFRLEAVQWKAKYEQAQYRLDHRIPVTVTSGDRLPPAVTSWREK